MSSVCCFLGLVPFFDFIWRFLLYAPGRFYIIYLLQLLLFLLFLRFYPIWDIACLLLLLLTKMFIFTWLSACVLFLCHYKRLICIECILFGIQWLHLCFLDLVPAYLVHCIYFWKMLLYNIILKVCLKVPFLIGIVLDFLCINPIIFL